MENTHTIEVTCILTDSQFQRLQAVTEIIKQTNKNWDERMALQLAIGNAHMTENVLLMLESYVEENIKEKERA